MKDKYEQRIMIAVEDDSNSWRAHLLLEKHRAKIADAPPPSSRVVLERLAKIEALLDLPHSDLQRLQRRAIRLRKEIESSQALTLKPS